MKNLGFFLNPDQIMDADQGVFRTGLKKFIPLEPFTNKSGELFWFSTTKIPLKVGDLVKEILVVSSDITFKINKEQTLQRSESRFRSAFEKQLFWNHCSRQIAEYSEYELGF